MTGTQSRKMLLPEHSLQIVNFCPPKQDQRSERSYLILESKRQVLIVQIDSAPRSPKQNRFLHTKIVHTHDHVLIINIHDQAGEKERSILGKSLACLRRGGVAWGAPAWKWRRRLDAGMFEIHAGQRRSVTRGDGGASRRRGMLRRRPWSRRPGNCRV